MNARKLVGWYVFCTTILQGLTIIFGTDLKPRAAWEVRIVVQALLTGLFASAWLLYA